MKGYILTTGYYKDRALRLRDMGYYEKMYALREDPSVDVRERITTALAHLNELS